MNLFNSNIPFLAKISNQNEKENPKENKEVTSILISNSYSEGNDIIKRIEMIEKEMPLKTEKKIKKVNSNDSLIFNYGIYDNYSKQMIYEALEEAKKNGEKKKKKKRDLKPFFHFRKKKKKNILKRKQNTDNIRKKIKSRFLKSLKNAINQKLKNAGAKLVFTYLPQSFVCNLSKKKNKEVSNMTLKQIFAKNFCYGKKRKADLAKYEHNLFVLQYLENCQEISEKSNFNIIKNMKYSEIFNEYLKSKEFGLQISTLKQEKEDDKYIKDYIVKAINLINAFNH